MTTVEKYTRQLILALRLRNIPGQEIGDAVAQVESHIAETGEDPVAVFGPAREYAASFGGTTLPRRWPWFIVNWLVGSLFGGILIVGVLGQARGVAFWEIQPTIAIVVGAIGLFGYVVAILLIWAERVRDPRKASHQPSA